MSETAAPPAAQGVPSRGAVRHVLVVAHADKSPAQELLPELAEWLRARDGIEQVDVEPDVRAFSAAAEARLRDEVEGPRPDLAVVLGGDGTMLGVVRAFRRDPVPTLGINFGRMGFLAACVGSHWERTLEDVLEGRGILDERMRLRVEFEAEGRQVVTTALNEVAIQRGAHQGMLTTRLSVGDVWVTDYRADGVVVATPTGSTAYSLSAGGPILAPDMLGIVVTPLSSQGLSDRPIVLHPETRLTARVCAAGGRTTLVLDGQAYYGLEPDAAVDVQRHPVPYPLLNMPGLDPYRRLRSRLGWGPGEGAT